MPRRIAPVLLVCSLLAGCIAEKAPSGGSSGTADTGTNAEDQFVDFAPIDDVVTREACSLADSTTFVGAAIGDGIFPSEADISAESEYAVGEPPSVYDDRRAFSITWANAVDDTVHIVAGTAVDDAGNTVVEYPAYHELELNEGVQVSAMTIEPLGELSLPNPLYRVRLLTTEGIFDCKIRNTETSGIVTDCEEDTKFDEYVKQELLDPLQGIDALPNLNDDGFINPFSNVVAGHGGTSDYRLGAARLDYQFGSPVLTPMSFPEFGTIQSSPFFESLVLGVSDEANSSPYLLILRESGETFEPLVLASNEAGRQYLTLVDEWSLVPDFTPETGKFAFVSSLDVTVASRVGIFIKLDTAKSDANFGYVTVLKDGSLGFSRPGGWDDRPFRRWVPPTPIDRIWAFENLAHEQPPGDPIILARTTEQELVVLRWNLNRSIEVIPDALANSEIDTLRAARGNYLYNHDGSVALKVDRGPDTDIAIVNLASVRDFSDALCR